MLPESLEITGIGTEVLLFFACLIPILACSYFLVQNFFTKSLKSSTSFTDLMNMGSTRSENGQCSICLDDIKFAVQTNCGHLFCSTCIQTYHERFSGIVALSCPYCRQKITVLLPCFSEEEKNLADLELVEQRSKTLMHINSYNLRFSGEPRSFLEHIRDLPILIQHFFRYIFTADGLGVLFRLRLLIISIMLLLYCLSPLDIISESVFGMIGLMDDLIIVVLFFIYLNIIFRNLLAQRGYQIPLLLDE